MAKYFLTNKAVEDLSNIWDYTYETWSEKQADRYYQLLIDKSILGYQTIQHIIFYRAIAPDEIEVIRILHGRMDLKNRMKE